MQRRYSNLLLATLLVAGAAYELRAEDPKPTKIPAKVEAKTSVGSITIGGKTHKLPHVVAYPVKVFDEEGIAVLFCEKEIPVEKLKAALIKDKGSDDSFNLFEPQVKVNFNKAGEPSFSNSWADNNSISVSGGGLKGELVVKDGRAIGQATMTTGDKPEDKKSFDIRFDVALLAVTIPKAEPKPESKSDDSEKPKSKSRKSKKKDGEKAKPAAGGELNIYDLPLPEDVTDLKYTKLTENLVYKSPSSVTKVTEFLVKELSGGGWTSDASDLKNPKTAILHREKEGAELTIFVKTDGAGSKVTIMSKGLSWEEKPKPDSEKKPKE